MDINVCVDEDDEILALKQFGEILFYMFHLISNHIKI